jgi:hypothetical protein
MVRRFFAGGSRIRTLGPAWHDQGLKTELNLGVKAVRDESHRWPSACDLKEHRQNKDEGKSALAPQNDSVCSRVFRGKSRRSHGPRTPELYRPPQYLPPSAPLLFIGAIFVVLALAGCASVAAGPGQAPNAPYQQADPRDTSGMH